MLPNFIVLGAPRCATTWLFQCLWEHPEVYVPEKKELRFFDENFDKGLGWYKSQFRPSHEEIAVGEVATKYLSREKVPKRIKNILPKPRLIVCLRNPTERAFSAYGHDLRKKKHSLSFEKGIKKYYREYIERGFYYDQIKRYLEFFSMNQILILIYDDLIKDPVATIQNVYRFLGANSNFVPLQARQRRNRGIARKNSPLINFFIWASNKALDIKIFRYVVTFLKKTDLANKVLEKIIFSQSSDKMRPETRQKLREIYYEQNRKLSEFLERDLMKIWK